MRLPFVAAVVHCYFSAITLAIVFQLCEFVLVQVLWENHPKLDSVMAVAYTNCFSTMALAGAKAFGTVLLLEDV